MDTLGIEPRASRMLSGCDTTTPRALESPQHSPGSLIFAKRGCGQGQRQMPCALLSSVQAGELLQPDTLGHVAWSAFFAAAGFLGLPHNGVACGKLGDPGTEGRGAAVAEW